MESLLGDKSSVDESQARPTGGDLPNRNNGEAVGFPTVRLATSPALRHTSRASLPGQPRSRSMILLTSLPLRWERPTSRKHSPTWPTSIGRNRIVTAENRRHSKDPWSRWRTDVTVKDRGGLRMASPPKTPTCRREGVRCLRSCLSGWRVVVVTRSVGYGPTSGSWPSQRRLVVGQVLWWNPLPRRHSTAGGCEEVDRTGRSSAWLERLLWEQEVAGSNPVVPTQLDFEPFGEFVKRLSLFQFKTYVAESSVQRYGFQNPPFFKHL